MIFLKMQLYAEILKIFTEVSEKYFFFRGEGICADPDKSVIFIVTIQLIIFEIIGMPMLPFNAVKHKLRTS